MQSLKRTAISIVLIMILSTMSGLVHHEIRSSDEFVEDYVLHLASENPELVVSALYENYDCDLYELFPDADRTEVAEACGYMFLVGDEHNTDLRSLMKTMDRMDVDFGESPEKDLMLYDRVILQNGDPELMEHYNRWRGVHQHSLELANYHSNHTSMEQQQMLINATVSNLHSYCDLSVADVYEASNSTLKDSCISLSEELQDYLNPAIDNMYADSQQSFVDFLEPDEDASIGAKLALMIVKSGAHASMSYWACDENTASLRDLNTVGSERWCSVMDETRERVESTNGSSGGQGNDETDAEEETGNEVSMARGGGYEHTKTWKEMTLWEQIKFIADCIGLVAGVILIIAAVAAIIAGLTATGGVAWPAVAAGFGELFKYGFKVNKFFKSLFPQHDIDYILAQLQEDCSDGIDNDGDGYIDCDDQDCFGDSACDTGPDPTPPPQPVQRLGDLNLYNSPNYVRLFGQVWHPYPEPYNWDPSIPWNHGWSEPCSYSYHPGPYASDRVILDNSLLQRSWTVTPMFTPTPPSPAASIGSGIGEFYQEGQYAVTYTEFHPDAVDSPQTVTRIVSVAHECDEEVPNELPADPHNPTWFSAIQTSPPLVSTEKWYETALRDLGRTMRDSAWMDEKSCGKEDWYCVAGTVAAIEHNNMLGAMVDSQHETGIYSPIYSDSYYNNIDALIVATNNSQIIESHFATRDDWVASHERLLRKLASSPYDSESIAYAGLAVAIDENREAGTPEAAYQALKYVHDNWNAENAHETYIEQLKMQIKDEEFGEMDRDTKLSIHSQLAILQAHDPILLGTDAYARGPILKGIKDAAKVAITIVDPSSWFQGHIDEARESFKHAEPSENSHPGFSGVDICETANGQKEDVICTEVTYRSLLDSNNYFQEERTAASANANVCGEDADLVELKTAIGKVDYKVSDPVEYVLTADCTLNGYEYKIKTEVVDSAGLSVYAEKIGIWEETDNNEIFTITIEDGLDEGTYCVNSMLFEHMNSVPISVSSGTDCFDVDPARSNGDGEGWWSRNIPGFTGMTAFIAMLGAALIAFRRLEDQ